MEDLINQLQQCTAAGFFSLLKRLCEEKGFNRYLIDFSLNEALFFIPGANDYLLLCVCFTSEDHEVCYLDKAGYVISATGHRKSPLLLLKKKKSQLEDICRQLDTSSRIFLALATEYSLLNPAEDLPEGLDLVKTNVSIARETHEACNMYNKYARLQAYLTG